MPSSKKGEIHYYKLTEDNVVTAGTVAPYFDFPGGGMQYIFYKSDGKTMYTIDELIDLGILIEVDKNGNEEKTTK